MTESRGIVAMRERHLYRAALLLMCLTALFGMMLDVAGEDDHKGKKGLGAKESKPSELHVLAAKDFESSFTWEQVQADEARIAVWNGSTATQDVKVKATELSPLTPTLSLPAGSSITMSLSPNSAKIGPHETVSFQVKFVSSPPHLDGPANFAGTVEIDSGIPGTAPIFHQLLVTVPPPRPALSKVTFTAWRYFPYSSYGCAKGKIPLTDETGQGPLPKVVGYVQGDVGWGAVKWTKIEESPAGDRHPAETTLPVFPVAPVTTILGMIIVNSF